MKVYSTAKGSYSSEILTRNLKMSKNQCQPTDVYDFIGPYYLKELTNVKSVKYNNSLNGKVTDPHVANYVREYCESLLSTYFSKMHNPL